MKRWTAVFFRLVAVTAVLWLPASSAAALDFRVTYTNDIGDANPGDGICGDTSGHCTLRAAVEEANSRLGEDRIEFGNPGMVITLGSILYIYQDVKIEGFGPGFTTIEGSGFQTWANLELKGLTLRDGTTLVDVRNDTALSVDNCEFSGATEGAITAFHGSLNLIDSTFTGNASTTTGGAVSIYSPLSGTGLTISGCTFDGNSASQGGGAVYFDLGHVLVVEDSIFENNSSFSKGGAFLINSDVAVTGRISGSRLNNNSAFFGGAIAVEGDQSALEIIETEIGFNDGHLGGGGLYCDTTGSQTITLRESSVYANETLSDGGGLVLLGDEILNCVNTTIALNKAEANGGGISCAATVTGAVIYSSTVTGNVADSASGENAGSGGGLFVEDGAGLVFLRNTILAGNEDLSTGTFSAYAPDCQADVGSEGYNLIGYANLLCDGASWSTGDQVGNPTDGAIDPRMSTLMQQPWWPTMAYTLLSDSPAIDAADPAGCYGLDGSLLTRDQIGRPRPYLNGSDIGAFETGPSMRIFSDGFENGAIYWSEVVGE